MAAVNIGLVCDRLALCFLRPPETVERVRRLPSRRSTLQDEKALLSELAAMLTRQLADTSAFRPIDDSHLEGNFRPFVSSGGSQLTPAHVVQACTIDRRRVNRPARGKSARTGRRCPVTIRSVIRDEIDQTSPSGEPIPTEHKLPDNWHFLSCTEIQQINR